MRNRTQLIQLFGFTVLVILLVILIFLVVITHIFRDLTSANSIVAWIISQHISIMIGLVIISIAFGFMLSSLSYSQLRKSEHQNKTLKDLLMLFLAKDEHLVVEHLLEHNGESNQAEISRLDGMNRVKAYRLLQKMQEKELVEITPHGKIRKVSLHHNIKSVFLENNKKKETKIISSKENTPELLSQ